MVKLQQFEPDWVIEGALKAAFLFELEDGKYNDEIFFLVENR